MSLILHSITTPNFIFSHLLKAATLAVTVIVMAVPEECSQLRIREYGRAKAGYISLYQTKAYQVQKCI